jgi:hypothetical protein
MAQIIKHRRGGIGTLKDVTARVGELVMTTGSISDLNGPMVFIGETEGVAGAYRPVSKIFQGSVAPTISVGSYGSVIDGTPFYASGNKSLYVLNKDGNNRLDLTGNIEGNTISGLTINRLNGNLELNGDLFITGNTSQTGSIDLTGNVTLGGNITIGNQTTDLVVFQGEVSSSIVPEINNVFDLGTPTQAWRNLHVSGTAYVGELVAETISLSGITVFEDLIVQGDTYLGNGAGDEVFITGNTYIGNLTQNRVTVAGANGLLTDYSGLTFDSQRLKVGAGNFEVGIDGGTRTSGSLQVGAGNFEVTGNNGNVRASGSLTVKGGGNINGNTYIGGDTKVTGSLETVGGVSFYSTLNVTGSTRFHSTIEVDSTATVSSSIVEDLNQDRIVFVAPGGRLTDDINFQYNGSELKIGQGTFEVDDNDGDIRTSGSLLVQGSTIINDRLDVTGDLTITGNTSLLANLYVSGTLEVLGSSTQVNIQSTTVNIDDNIIRLNAYSPFERYAGFEVIDSGSSGVSASLVWDSLNDYWMFVSASGQSSKLIGTTAGAYGAETSLTSGTFPIATDQNTIGDSLLTYSGTTLALNTNKFLLDSSTGNATITGNVTLSYSGGTDNGNKTSAIVFKNSSNVLGYVSTTESTDVLDGILGYKNSDGTLKFSTVIDGGTY